MSWNRRLMMTGAVKSSEMELDYLTVYPSENAEIRIIVTPWDASSQYDIKFYYRIDSEDWVSISNQKTIYIESGSKAQFKCDIREALDAAVSQGFSINLPSFKGYSSSDKHIIAGTPMSIWYGDDFREYKDGPSGIFMLLFMSDQSLIRIENPETFLPAKELMENCYNSMFADCVNLENAPVLPASVLQESSYESMFNRCSKLNYIKMLATDISASYCLDRWVYGVSKTGTFVKSKDATWNTTPGALGDAGVPAGWTVITE